MFLILNYLSKLDDLQKLEYHPSWIKAQCPICGGSLKIVSAGTKAGAYSCYTNDCQRLTPNPIREYLTRGEFKPRSSRYALRKMKLPQLQDIIKPLELNLKEVDDTQFYTDIVYKKPWSSINEVGDKITIYNYQDFSLVRIDPASHKNKKKFFYFRVKDANNNWVNEVPTKFKNVPVYRSEYISEYVIFCEGEKCASSLQSLGLFALSFPSFVYQQSYLAKFLRCLSYKVKNIIYLEDNDETGKSKARKFLQEAWKSGINASSFNIAELLGRGSEKNYDAADAIDSWEICTREELLGLLKGCSIQKVSA
jgi:hypothetical protein